MHTEKIKTLQDLVDIDNGTYVCDKCKAKAQRKLDREHSTKHRQQAKL